MKHAQELGNVGLLAVANLTVGGVKEFFSGVEPFLHVLISFGQFAVAVVTVLYIVKKIRNMKDTHRDDPED
jgi:hypothetical protein